MKYCIVKRRLQMRKSAGSAPQTVGVKSAERRCNIAGL